MRDPVEGAILDRSDKIRLLDELEHCLGEWSRAASAQAPLSDPRVAQLRTQTLGLQPLARNAGFGGIAVRIDTLRQHVDSHGRATDLSPFLSPLRELVSAARESLAEAAIAQQPAPSPLPQNHANFGRTQVIGGPEQRPLQLPAAVIQQHQPQPPTPSPPMQPQQPGPQPSGLVQPPPMLGASIFLQQAAPNPSSHDVRLPPSAPAPPPLLNQSMARPRQLDGEGAGVPRVAGPEFHAPVLGRPLPQQSASEAPPLHQAVVPPRSFGPNGPASVPKNAPDKSPNLQVRTMFGLRAFGARKTDANAVSTPPQAAGPIPDKGDQRSSSLLDLKRGSRHSSRPTGSVGAAGSPEAPRLLDHSLAGLPALPPTVNPPGIDGRLSSAGFSQSIAKLSRLDVLGDVVRLRGRDRRGGGSTPSPALLRNREKPSSTWRIGAIAVAVFALVLGGLATLIIVLTRTPREAGVDAAKPQASSQGTKPVLATSGALPQPRLITENESLRALLSQMHGRGKESAELSALVDEEAALIASSLSPEKCKGSPAACQAMAAMHASVIGAQGTKRISQRRATGSMDRVRSRWLVGLKLPEIPVEDDPRVERSLQFYTENPVGRESFQSMLFRCGSYRDLIQSTLVRYELPADLWAIVFVESGCTPQATSPVGAAGLWQFMPATGRAYHLRIKEEVIDERRSPPKSTEAAVRYLRDIRDKLLVYNEAGVWDLTFGSYNLGPFGMIARLERVGGSGIGFWDLVDAKVLPDETAMYAPAIQAVALILNNLQRYKFSTVQMRTPQLTSDLEVPPGTRLSLVARAASMSTRDLRAMNLDISGESTPDIPNLAIQVPKDVVWQARDTLKDLMANQDQMDQCVPPTFDWGRQRFTKEMAAACQRKLGAKSP